MELPDNLISEIKIIHREVKQFVTNEFSYYGITHSGFLFDIIKSKNIQPSIDNIEDFHNYLWVECLKGYYLLSQRFIKEVPQEWYLEAEIIPPERYPLYFHDMMEYFEKNPEMLQKVRKISEENERSEEK